MKRSTTVSIIVIGLALGAITYFNLRSTDDDAVTSETQEHNATKTSNDYQATTNHFKTTSQPAPQQARAKLSDDDAERIVSSLSELITNWRQSRDNMSEELRAAWHTDRKRMVNELGELLKGSETLRQEFYALLANETDPFIQNHLIGATRHLQSADKQELAQQLVQSETASTRQLGVELLPKVGTEQAFTQLKQQIATDASVDVQKTAVVALAKFDLVELRGNSGGKSSPVAAYQINESLRSIVENYGADPDLRESAFRGLIGRVRLSQDDKNFVDKIAADGSNPKLQDLAIKAKQAYARQRRK